MPQSLDDIRNAVAPRYRLDMEIGRGGMAAVYLAEDTQLGRSVAIKVFDPAAGPAVSAERFSREIRVLAQLNHPNILPVLDSGESRGMLYFVMPFVEGESLAARLVRERQLPVDEAVAITCEIADALTYAHAAGVIHRDIKPGNVLLSGGHPVVADFGIARLLEDDGAGKLTMTGVSVGTAAYMSPEQSAGDAVDARADQYSLACLLYELLVGAPPFAGPTAMAVMARHRVELPPGIRVVRGTVPEELEATVMRALEKSPVDRFRSVAEFKAALMGEAPTAVTLRYSGRYSARYATITEARATRRWTPARIAASVAVVGLAGLTAAYATRAGLLQGQPTLPDNAARIAITYFTDAPGSGLRYLADAVTENLVEQLDAASVDVAPLNAVRAYRGASIPAESLGRALDVGTVVRGSVEPDGDGVRVTVQLWDALDDRELDRREFRADTDSPVQLQGRVVAGVADLVRERVGRELDLRVQGLGTSVVPAWTTYRRAELRRKDADSLLAIGDATTALAHLRAADSLLAVAERLDPRWATVPTRRAYVALGEAQSLRGEATLADRRAAVARGLAHADRALALDPRSADALNAKGDLLHFQFANHLIADPATAERTLVEAESVLVRAVRIDRDQAGAWATLSALYYRKPDMQAVVNAAYEALRADKYLASARVIQARLFYARYNTEDFLGATTACDEGRRRFPADPTFVQCRLFLYMTPRAGTPDPDSAWAYAARMVALTPERSRSLARRRADVLVAGALAAAGLPDSARRVLDRARPDAVLDPQRSVIGWEAAVRLMLGEKDVAVDLLREYVAVNPEHKRGFAARTGWWWRDIQDYPRFKSLIVGG